MTVRIQIDDALIQAEPGEFLIEVARKNGFDIPSLCHHQALLPIGACRVCLVEVRPKGKPPQVTTACDLRVSEGQSFWTDTPLVRRHRAMNLELLLARAPQAPRIRELAGRYGVARPRFAAPAYQPLPGCILCEVCVRACALQGHHALTVVGRGDRKRIGLPFNQPSPTCVGCASCAHVCPTSCIPVKETREARTIWGQTQPFRLCRQCGAPVMTERQRAHAIESRGLPEDYYDSCEQCKQSAASQRFAALVW